MSFINQPERVIPVDKVIGIGSDTDHLEPQGPRRLRAVVGVLAGLAIGLLLATGAQQRSPDPDTAPQTIPELAPVATVPTTTLVLEPSRLDILADGYSGTLYLAGQLNRQGKLWRWESRTGTPLDLGAPNLMVGASFNASGARLGLSSGSALSPLLVLWVGTPGNEEPLAVDVFSWEWHASDPSQIAWIEIRGTADTPEIALRISSLPISPASTIPLEDVGEIVQFDDSGLILETVTEDGYELWSVDSEGLETGRLGARFLGTLPDGSVLVSQAGRLLTTSRDLADPEPFEFPSEKRMDSIKTSPVGAMWAIWEIEEITGVAAPAQLWILEGEEIIFETTLSSALRALSWSRDGRWLIAAVGEPSPLSGFSSGELWFIDTQDWSMHLVAAPGFVSEIAAVP